MDVELSVPVSSRGSTIEGLTLTELGQIDTERGSVLHMLRCDEPTFTRFGETYFSEVLPGAVKAWRRHRTQTQNLAVPVGRICMVVFDDRNGSATRGTVQVIELGRPVNYRRLRIPPGVWYGFACLGDSPALLANCADFPHDPSESEQLPMNDPRIPYSWRSTRK